jgi:purine-binding chemotaxis protein CheW
MLNTDICHLLVFIVDEQEYALPYTIVEKVVRSVEITPLPNAPDIIKGIINVHGRVIPVLSVREKLGCHGRDIDLEDKFVIAKAGKRVIAFVVDDIVGIIEPSAKEVVDMDKIIPDSELFGGTVKLPNNLVLIYNAEKFLSLKDEEKLQDAMADVGC